MPWKEPLRRIMEALGYSVHRWPASRFDGMRDALRLLRDANYAPRVIIDCGANRGHWTRLALAVFPGARFHLIEPQPACELPLRKLAARTPRVAVHPVAVSGPGVASVRIIGARDVGDSTGAWVALPGETGQGGKDCPATTLDALVADGVTSDDRTLLKLDLEGHELAALRGAGRLLQRTEVVLTEVQFYEIEGGGRPVFADVVAFFRERGFELYDFACLSQRPRDRRLRMGDVIFVREGSPLRADRSWT